MRSRQARKPGQRCFAPRPGGAPAGLVVRSDQGGQYTATRFKDLVAQPGVLQSMSWRGNCYGNAPVESLWRRFTAELLDGGSFPSLAKS